MILKYLTGFAKIAFKQQIIFSAQTQACYILMIVFDGIIGAHVPTVTIRTDIGVASLFLENTDLRNLEKSAPKKSKLTAIP